MNRHTPGPWDAERDDQAEQYDIGHRRVDVGQRHVATVSFGYDEPAETEQHANAALIASAPDLLDALSKFVTAAKSWHEFHHGSKDIACDWLCECIPAGEAALAKAIQSDSAWERSSEHG